METDPSETARVLQHAFGFHKQGQLGHAEKLYRQVLANEPTNFAALQLLGALRGQQGNQTEAIALIESALKIKPNDLGALSNYGSALAAADRHSEAVATFGRVLTIKPDYFLAHYTRGVSLSKLKRFEDAVTSFGNALAIQTRSAECYYNRALALTALAKPEMALDDYDKALLYSPQLADALENRGNILRELGRLNEALDSYNRALVLRPRSVLALYNRGVALLDMKRPEEAIASHDAALIIKPDFPEAWFNRGVAQLVQERFTEALASLDRGLALRSADVKALGDRAVALQRLGLHDEALGSCNQALARDPDHVPALMTRGQLLRDAARFPEALADYDRVLNIDPNHAPAWNNRGATLHATDQIEEALASFDKAVGIEPDMVEALSSRAYLLWKIKSDYDGALKDLIHSIALDPDQPYARGQLLRMKMQVADWADFDREIALIDKGVQEGRRVIRPFAYLALSRSPADLQACSRIFASSSSISGLEALKRGPRSHRRKIRIGYVSGEFREHATAYLMAGLYEAHDRERFEVIGVDNGGPNASDMRKRLDAAFDDVIDISKLPDREAAERVQAAQIDILVDLNGYFGAPRIGVFARRPAPLQVNYLGFPGTLGVPYMDYIIADNIVIPEGERCFYDEQVVWLPNSYQANDRKRPIAGNVPSRATLGLPEDGFVFCSFNQSYKLTPQTFASWMRILKAKQGSVLWLLDGNAPFAENLSIAAEGHGVARDRIVFAPPIRADQHLARLKQADLFLDTLPCNAHTTASDALWAGLPLLTCRGSAFSGRVAASLLNAICLAELVADDLEGYEALAIRMATESSFQQSIRQKLALNRLNTPLFDTDQFRRNIEAAYIQMWEIAERGEPPSGFTVSPDA